MTRRSASWTCGSSWPRSRTEGVLHRAGPRWHWARRPTRPTTSRSAASRATISSSFDTTALDATQTKRRQIIAEVDWGSAFATIHSEGDLPRESEPYEVAELHFPRGRGEGRLRKRVQVDYFTDAISAKGVWILQRLADEARPRTSRAGRGARGREGRGLQEDQDGTLENVGSGEVELPQQEMQTTAVWITVGPETLEHVSASREELIDGLRAVTYLLHHLARSFSCANIRDLGLVARRHDAGGARGRRERASRRSVGSSRPTASTPRSTSTTRTRAGSAWPSASSRSCRPPAARTRDAERVRLPFGLPLVRRPGQRGGSQGEGDRAGAPPRPHGPDGVPCRPRSRSTSSAASSGASRQRGRRAPPRPPPTKSWAASSTTPARARCWSSGASSRSPTGTAASHSALPSRHGWNLLGAVARARCRSATRAGSSSSTTETTGLAGGTGTYAFLGRRGMARGGPARAGAVLHARFDEEGALLATLAALGRAGQRRRPRSTAAGFDLPLLEPARPRAAALAGGARAPRSATPSRRVWGARFADCRLATLEREVLGLRRRGRLPGALIPGLTSTSPLRAPRACAGLRPQPDDVLSLVARSVVRPGAGRDDRLLQAEDLAGLGDSGSRWTLSAPSRATVARSAPGSRRSAAHRVRLRLARGRARGAPGTPRATVAGGVAPRRLRTRSHGRSSRSSTSTRTARSRRRARDRRGGPRPGGVRGAPDRVVGALTHRLGRLERRLPQRSPRRQRSHGSVSSRRRPRRWRPVHGTGVSAGGRRARQAVPHRERGHGDRVSREALAMCGASTTLGAAGARGGSWLVLEDVDPAPAIQPLERPHERGLIDDRPPRRSLTRSRSFHEPERAFADEVGVSPAGAACAGSRSRPRGESSRLRVGSSRSPGRGIASSRDPHVARSSQAHDCSWDPPLGRRRGTGHRREIPAGRSPRAGPRPSTAVLLRRRRPGRSAITRAGDDSPRGRLRDPAHAAPAGDTHLISERTLRLMKRTAILSTGAGAERR